MGEHGHMLELDWQAHASLWPPEAEVEGETSRAGRGWELAFNVCSREPVEPELQEPTGEISAQPWELAEMALANVAWA